MAVSSPDSVVASLSDPLLTVESLDLPTFDLPNPEDQLLSEQDFHQQIEDAWQTCDRVDLLTEIWRGRILRVVRDREKQGGEGRGTGFLNWLRDREISKSRAYSLIELANSADTLLADGTLDPAAVERFSKRAFVETSQAAPEVQQLITDAARSGERITRREVRQLADEWTAMTSDLLPEAVRERAATQDLSPRYLAPLVREMEKLPSAHQVPIQTTIAASPDVETLKFATREARRLAKYLGATTQIQALHPKEAAALDLEQALVEAQRLDCLGTAADLVTQAAQLEQTIARLYTTWKRVGALADRLYVDSGASTPHLRSLLARLSALAGESVEVSLGTVEVSRRVRLQIQEMPEVGA